MQVGRIFLSAFDTRTELVLLLLYQITSLKRVQDRKLKSVNLQYNTLGSWVNGPNDSATKRLVFQVLLFFHNFLQNSLQKSFQFLKNKNKEF
jgi:hypothetical protein